MIASDGVPTDDRDPASEPLAALRVLEWLLPAVFVLWRSNRGSRVAWALASLDIVLVAVLSAASVAHLDQPDWIGELGTETVPSIGVLVEPEPRGLRVTGVVPDSAASVAGVQVDDVIGAVDNVPFRERAALASAIQGRPVGTVFAMHLLRGPDVWVTTLRSQSRRRISAAAIQRSQGLFISFVAIAGLIVLAIVGLAWSRGVARAWLPLWAMALIAAPAAFSEPLPRVLVTSLAAALALWSMRLVPRLPTTTWPRTLRISGGIVLAVPALVFRGGAIFVAVAIATDTPMDPAPLQSSLAGASTYGWYLPVLLIPILEEAAYRGLVLPVAYRAARPWTAITLAALSFGLSHGLGLSTNIWGPVALGFALTYLRLRTGRLLPGIVLHAAWNGMTLIVPT